jgi:hypothetical protein
VIDRQRHESIRRVRVLALALATVGAMLLGPSTVLAAVAYEISTQPGQPIVGQPAVITITTTIYGSGGGGATPAPLPMAEFAWEFVADAPSGARHSIPLTPMGSSGNRWSATFEFDEAGEWEIGLHPRHLSTPLDPSLGARATVRVVDTATPPSTDEVVLGSNTSQGPWPLALLAVLVVGVLVLARRSRDIGRR